MSDSATPCTAAGQVPPFSTIPQSLLGLMPIDSMMLSNHLILCCPLLLLSSISPSIRVLPNKLALCIKWPKYCSFSISSFHEYSGLISFRIDWFDLFAVQRILNSLLQHHNLKASIHQCSAFFMVQLSHSYMINIKTIVLTICTFVSKVTSLDLSTILNCFKHEITWVAFFFF